jgi:hypothetical protein
LPTLLAAYVKPALDAAFDRVVAAMDLDDVLAAARADRARPIALELLFRKRSERRRVIAQTKQARRFRRPSGPVSFAQPLDHEEAER